MTSPGWWRKAKVSKDIEIVDLGACYDHPMVIAALKEKIDQALAGWK